MREYLTVHAFGRSLRTALPLPRLARTKDHSRVLTATASSRRYSNRSCAFGQIAATVPFDLGRAAAPKPSMREQIPCVFDDRKRVIGRGPKKIEQLPHIVGKCRTAALLENHRLDAFERHTTATRQQHCGEARFRF